MNNFSTSFLVISLIILIIASGFFSSAETALMRLNRYRLRHQADNGNRAAKLAQKLLAKPDRLIGLILLGNNFVNFVAASLTTLLGMKLAGEFGVAIATIILTFVILIFAEVAPKSFAAFHPQQIAYPASYILTPLSKIFFPVVYIINYVANLVLKLLGIPIKSPSSDALNKDELRSIVAASGKAISTDDQTMLVNLLDLNALEVEDIMVPRNEITGINLENSWQKIKRDIGHSYYTRLPVFTETVDNTIGELHVRSAIKILKDEHSSLEQLKALCRKPYFIPEGTKLGRQLLEFRQKERRMGLVVDEYGDILGLLTLDDILEEIVGEFTTEPRTHNEPIKAEQDNSFYIDGSASIKALNRQMCWSLPTNGPRTINGLLLELLEDIPQSGTSVKVNNLVLTIVKTQDNTVKTVTIKPIN